MGPAAKGSDPERWTEYLNGDLEFLGTSDLLINGPTADTTLEDCANTGPYGTEVARVDMGGGLAIIQVYLEGLRPLSDRLWAEYKFRYASVRWRERPA
jgi:hypothetical protein